MKKIMFTGIFIILSLLCLSFSYTVSALSNITNTGDLAGEQNSMDGYVSWTTPDNARTTNNIYASIAQKTAISEYLYVYDYDFSDYINPLDTLNGIVVTIERMSTSATKWIDYEVYLTDSDGVSASDNKADLYTYYPTSDTNKTYGSSSDLWGGYLTMSDILDSDFGVLFSCTQSSSVLTSVKVDYIGITIYYTPNNPAPPTNLIVNTVYSSDTQLSLTWTKGLGADKTRVMYKTGSNPTMISDGTLAYNDTGSSYTVGSLTNNVIYYFSAWSWNTSTKTYSITYVSANKRVYTKPIKPTDFIGNNVSLTRNLFAWTKGVNATVTRIQYNVNSSYPSTISTGTNTYNSTNTYNDDSGLTKNSSYYYSAWSFNITNGLWSSDYATLKINTNDSVSGGSCGSTALTVYNNTAYTTGKYQYVYSSSTGWKIWLNYTGILPTFNHYENILDATGTHQYNSVDNGYTINSWANYTGNSCPSVRTVTLYSNILNATGTHEYNLIGSVYNVWANYTGNITPLFQYDNIIDATGTHTYLLNSTGYYDWANYTGIGGGCSGIVWVNYTDSNLTFNVSINKTDNTNTSIYNISDDFWVYLGSTVTLDNFMILLIYLFALMYFIYNNKTNELFIKSKAHIIFIMFTIILLLGIEVGEFITDLGLTPIQRAMLSPFIFVFIILLWLTRKPNE